MHGSKLYVGNLGFSVNTDKVKELFTQYGEVKDIKIIEGRGFGFIEMGTQAEAEKAKAKLNGTEFDGRNIRVTEAKPHKKCQSRGYRKH